MRKIMFVLCLMASGCASNEAVMIGKDTYMLSDSSITGNGQLKTNLFAQAGRFCASKSKLPMVVSSSSSDMFVGHPATAEITFRCLAESDPEWKRPAIRFSPTATVEIQQK